MSLCVALPRPGKAKGGHYKRLLTRACARVRRKGSKNQALGVPPRAETLSKLFNLEQFCKAFATKVKGCISPTEQF